MSTVRNEIGLFLGEVHGGLGAVKMGLAGLDGDVRAVRGVSLQTVALATKQRARRLIHFSSSPLY